MSLGYLQRSSSRLRIGSPSASILARSSSEARGSRPRGSYLAHPEVIFHESVHELRRVVAAQSHQRWREFHDDFDVRAPGE